MRGSCRDLPLILIGAGGHAKVLLALARATQKKIIGVCDPQLLLNGQTRWEGLMVLGGDEVLLKFSPTETALIHGVGQRVGNTLRQQIYDRLRNRGFIFPTLIHPSAWVAPDAKLADGVQVMAGAIIQPACEIGENTIINTRASVDHDCKVSSHIHIAPGAVICGGVNIQSGAFVGAGAVIIQGISVGNAAVVGAGVTLTKNLESGRIVLGAEARLQ